jgi:hypothetical protein
MQRVSLIAFLLFPLALAGQPARPQFYADRVIPSFGEIPLMLAPAMLVSIYGDNLGPEEGCRGYGDQQHWDSLPPDNPFGVWERIVIYPTSLCGVQVKIGEVFAGLLWTQNKQINFEVPKEVPFGGNAELRVIKDGVASDPVPLEFGLERIKLTQDEPAYVDMPVWVRAHTSTDNISPLFYPIHFDPLRTECEVMEARWNGVPLAKITRHNPIGGVVGFGGGPCSSMGLPGKPSKTGRLPLHLLYRFDQPGQYEVRFTRLAGDAKTIRERSPWTIIHILPASSSQRAEWLSRMAKAAQAAPAELLSDFLLSLLGYGDANSLALLVGYLYNADNSVRQFVSRSLLAYYDKTVLLPALQQALRSNGPSQTVTELFRSLGVTDCSDFRLLTCQTH